jgi:hypothetical protein
VVMGARSGGAAMSADQGEAYALQVMATIFTGEVKTVVPPGGAGTAGTSRRGRDLAQPVACFTQDKNLPDEPEAALLSHQAA